MIEDMGDFGTGRTPPPVPPPGEQPAMKSRSKARGAAAGIGVALVVGAGGVAVASSGGAPTSGTPGASPTTEGAPPPAPGEGGMRRHGGLGLRGPGFGGEVLHGTYVVAKPEGGYQTIQTQNGTVSSVSATSIAVKSKDGYSFTYVVKSGTVVDAESAGISSVKKGDTVMVMATVSGKTATVTRVMDRTLLQKDLPDRGKARGYGGMMGGGMGGAPRPAPTATTSGSGV